MDRFDFDTPIIRKGSDCVKWDSADDEGVIPMWVADMDFRTAPVIIEALTTRAAHGAFGYTKVPAAYYDAIVSWFSRRHDWQIDPNHIIYTTGVVPAVSAVIRALTSEGDKVILPVPTYNCFFSSIRNNRCELSASELLKTDSGYRFDFDDLERRAADERAKVLLLCNPHNPVGRVWTREELSRIDEICSRNGVTVVSDEIHCEFVYNGASYTPFATVSAHSAMHSVICTSPSKAFNTAGLQTANIIASDENLRRKIDRAVNDFEICDIGPFGVEGLIAAYNNGAEWLDALLEYIWQNYLYLKDFFCENLPQYEVSPLEGTYLAWIDCSVTGMQADELGKLLHDEARVRICPGTMYGKGGENYIRINLACPRTQLKEALVRMNGVLGRFNR